MGNWLYNSLLKQWCDDNRIIYMEERDMTKGARVMIKRICDELMKWCEERHVMCEFATTDDEGLSATFMVGGTTLSVSHIELRDADEFSKYVKSVLFGVDESKDIPVSTESLCSRIEQLEKEDKEKAKDIEYLEKELEKVRNENTALRYQLNAERKGYGELEDQYNDKCKAFIDMCKHYDTEVNKRMKAEEELKKLKAERHDDAVDVTRYLVVLGKKKRAEEMIKSLKSQLSIHETMVDKLKNQNENLKIQIGDINLTKKKVLDKDAELIESLEKEVKRLEYTNNDLDNNVKDMFATVRSLKKENLKKDDEIKAFKFYVATLEDKLKVSADSNEELKAEIEVLLEKNYNLDNHVKNLVAQEETLKREINALEYKNIADAINSLDRRIAWIEPRLEYVENKIDVAAMHPSKDIKEKQEVIDVLNSLNERIAWMEDHVGSTGNDIARSIEKLEEDQRKLFHDELNIFTRLNKLEEDQPKKASKNPTKKSQKSDLS